MFEYSIHIYIHMYLYSKYVSMQPQSAAGAAVLSSVVVKCDRLNFQLITSHCRENLQIYCQLQFSTTETTSTRKKSNS